MICDLMGCAAIQCKRASLVLCDSFPGEPVCDCVPCPVNCVSTRTTNADCRHRRATIRFVERGPPSENNRAAGYALPHQAAVNCGLKEIEKPRAATARQVVSELDKRWWTSRNGGHTARVARKRVILCLGILLSSRPRSIEFWATGLFRSAAP